MLNLINRFLWHERGATATEYAMLVVSCSSRSPSPPARRRLAAGLTRGSAESACLSLTLIARSDHRYPKQQHLVDAFTDDPLDYP